MNKINIPSVVTDGQTIINRWTSLMELEDCIIFLSSSNYILGHELWVETLNILDAYDDKYFEFTDEHLEIGLLLNAPVNKAKFTQFLKSEDAFMEPHVVNEERNISVVVYKGVYDDDEDDIDLFIEEAVAFMNLTKSNNESMPLLTMNEYILEYIKEKKYDLDIIEL